MSPADTRRYTLSIEVEIKEQDDLAHFQRDSVTASVPALGITWVSGNDAEALRDFFAFFVRGPNPTMPRASIDAIVDRALDSVKHS